MHNTEQPDKIITAAIKLISSKGYSNVSLRDISNEAEVALSQLHYYYKNKEGLFVEVINIIVENGLKEIETHLDSNLSPKENLDNLVKYFESTVELTPEYIKLFIDLSSMALWHDRFKNILNSFYNNVALLIDNYVINGRSSKYSSLLISKTIFSSIFGAAVQYFMDPKSDKLKLHPIEMFLDF